MEPGVNGDDAHEMHVQTDADNVTSNDADTQSAADTAMSQFFCTNANATLEHDDDEQTNNDDDAAAAAANDHGEDPATSAHEFSLLIILQPDNVRHRVVATSELTIAELTAAICNDLKLDADLVSFPGLNPAPGCSLASTPLAAYGFTDTTNSSSSDERVLQAFVARPSGGSDYVMPPRIPVQVYNDQQNQYHTIYIDVEKFTGHKPYLGGFRHRKTQQLYHHASTQTFLSRARRSMGTTRAHRETQTQELVTRSLQTSRESGTQMARRDLRLDTSFDRHVSAKPYFDSFQLASLRDDSALLVQRLWRGYKARAYVYSVRELKRRVVVVGELEAREGAVEDANHQKREIFRRMHPKTVSDFEVLYNELDKWRHVETRKIHADTSLSIDARQAALAALLAKETKLLQTIDKLKLTATDGNRKQRIESMLQFLARPKQWQMGDGSVKEVHTPFTVRAQELLALYHGLRAPLASIDERLNMLLHVKWTVQEFSGSLTTEIVALVDREADLLGRGRKDKSLEGLRTRLANLFLQFIETPEYNPEAAALARNVAR